MPCIPQNKICLDVNTNKTKKYQEIFWYPTYFSQEDEFFSHNKKLHMSMWHYQQQGISKATGNETMLGFEPLTWCHHSNNGDKKDIVQKHLTCSK